MLTIIPPWGAGGGIPPPYRQTKTPMFNSIVDFHSVYKIHPTWGVKKRVKILSVPDGILSSAFRSQSPGRFRRARRNARRSFLFHNRRRDRHFAPGAGLWFIAFALVSDDAVSVSDGIVERWVWTLNFKVVRFKMGNMFQLVYVSILRAHISTHSSEIYIVTW